MLRRGRARVRPRHVRVDFYVQFLRLRSISQQL